MARSAPAPALLAAVALLLALPAPASAGTYVTHACGATSGIPAPIEGWHFERGGRAGRRFTRRANACPRGGGFTAQLPGRARATRRDFARWVFRTPPGTALTHLTLTRQVRAVAGRRHFTYAYSLKAYGATSPVLEACSGAACATLPGVRAFALPPGTRTIVARVACAPARRHRCGRAGGPVAASVTITSADVTIDDSAAPGPPPPLSGGAFQQAASGVRSLVIQARDAGSGVASFELRVDGQSVAKYDVTTCSRPVAGSYLTPTPCPNRRRFGLPFDTRGLSNGVHSVEVIVRDLTGNAGTSRQRLASVFNAGNPGLFARVRSVLISGRRRGGRLTVRYGSPLTIAGQLQDALGRPLSGLTVVAGPSGGGPRVRAGTDVQGRFSLAFPSASSNIVSVVAVAGSTIAGVQDLDLRVRPAMSLRVSSHRARNGQTIRFRGLVRPRPGQPLVATLQALDGQRWSNVGPTITVHSSGGFSTHYTARHTARRTRFAFRVHLARQGSYPLQGGSSRAVHVLVRP